MLNALEARVIAALKSAGVTWISLVRDSEYNVVLELHAGDESGLLTNEDFQEAKLLPINERTK